MTRFFTRWLLPRYAAGEQLPSPLRRLVRRALERDAALAAQYNAMRRAEHVIAGDPGLSAAQLDLLLAGVLEQTDAAAARQRASAGAPAWMPASLAAAAAAVVFVVSGSPSGSTGATGSTGSGLGDLTARSALLAQAPLGLRVRCVHHDVVTDDATAGARQSGDDLDCAADGLLAFSTTNLATSTRYAFVIGVDDDNGDRVWLAPFPRGSAARTLQAGVTDDVIDVLSPMQGLPERLTLHLLLSDVPFTSADVESRLSAAQRASIPLKHLDRLPVDVPIQARLTVQRR